MRSKGTITMNYKTYRIWRELLDNPNKWLSVTDVAHDVNMTSRQVSSIAGMMPSPPIIKERDKNDKNLYIMVSANDEELAELRKNVVLGYFGLSADMCVQVREALSPIGWMSVADISDDTGIERLDVSHILSILPDVLSKGTGSITLYKLRGCF